MSGKNTGSVGSRERHDVLGWLLAWCLVMATWVPIHGLDWRAPTVSPVPPMLSADAQSWLLINDPFILDEQLDVFARRAGFDTEPLRDQFAQWAYASRDMRGVDLERPSLLVWREGPAPLAAIIPIRDRAVFLDAFGQATTGQSPMVRVGERDGTLIFSQNSVDALWEYRLLVGENTVFLARTAEECRALAAQPPLMTDEKLPPILGELPTASINEAFRGFWMSMHQWFLLHVGLSMLMKRGCIVSGI